jgi:hypothetical protein
LVNVPKGLKGLLNETGTLITVATILLQTNPLAAARDRDHAFAEAVSTAPYARTQCKGLVINGRKLQEMARESKGAADPLDTQNSENWSAIRSKVTVCGPASSRSNFMARIENRNCSGTLFVGLAENSSYESSKRGTVCCRMTMEFAGGQFTC